MEPEDFDTTLEQLYAIAQSASSEGLTEEALKRCEEALTLIETRGEESETHSYADFVMLMGDVNWSAGEYEEAWRNYHRVVLNEPERVDARVAMGVALYHLCRFTASKTMLEMCSIEIPEDAETWYYLGLVALREGKVPLAKVYLDQAEELDEGRFQQLKEIPDETTLTLINTLIDQLPEPFRAILKKLPIVQMNQPTDELLLSADPPMEPTVPLIIEGTPAGEDESERGSERLERILVFRENIWLLASDDQELRSEVQATIRQEIAHFFKFTEDELDAKGME